MKLGKMIFGLVAFLLVAAIIGSVVFLNNINSVVKTVVEDVGSDTLKTQVKLENVDIDILGGRVVLTDLAIENPEGYSTPTIFYMKEIIVELELLSLLDNTVFIKEISIDGATITAEQKGRSTNVQKILDNVEQGPETKSQDGPDTDSSAEDEILIKVGEFKLTNSSASLVTEQWGAQDLVLKEVKLVDIGGDLGVPAHELANAVLKPILEELQASTEDRLKEIVKEKAKEKIKEKTDRLKDKAKSSLDKVLGEGTADKLKSIFSK